MTPQDAAHREATEARLSHEGRKYFKFIEFDAKEELVSEIRKDPVGLFLIYLTGAFVAVALTVISILAATADLDGLFGDGTLNQYRGLVLVLALFLLLGVAVSTAIAAFLYKSNVIYVTTEKIAQVLYVSLFNRKISQLSIGDVQDVTVTQKGLLAHIFDYGTLVIETAGEQQNYTFSYVPEPYEQSKLIVGAHERNLVEYGN